MNLQNPLLTTFWFEFPEDPSFPHGMGVSAFSLADALALLDDHCYDFHRCARRLEVRRGVSLTDIGYSHVAMNSGPLVFRGVWYPCLNLGWSALDIRAKRYARLLARPEPSSAA